MRILLSFILFASILVLIGCDSGAEEFELSPAIPVFIANVEQNELTLPVRRSGMLFARNEARLAFKIGGYIKNIFVREGQSVRNGTLLASLDLSEINAQVVQAQSAFEKAQRDLMRIERLFSDSVATLEQRQNAQTGLKVAEANLEIAQFNRRHAQIFAPSDGTVLKKFAEKNELIGPGTPVFYFAPTGQNWILRVGVSDRELMELQIGDSAHISFDSYPGKIFRAEISELARGADLMSGTFEVELALKKTPFPLVSGFVGRVSIYPSKQHTVSMIPHESLIEASGNEGYVFKWDADAQQITRTPIVIFAIFEEFIAVSNGLENVSQVIGKGAPYVSEQSKITIIQ